MAALYGGSRLARRGQNRGSATLAGLGNLLLQLRNAFNMLWPAFADGQQLCFVDIDAGHATHAVAAAQVEWVGSQLAVRAVT